MPKKTKKQKLKADHHRSYIPKPADQISNLQSGIRKTDEQEKPSTYSFTGNVKLPQKPEPHPVETKNDIIKTVLFALIIFAIELAIFFKQKYNF